MYTPDIDEVPTSQSPVEAEITELWARQIGANRAALRRHL